MADVDLRGNLTRFSGFADTYDSVRPRPPAVLIELLTQLAGGDTPERVVDIGSGTGLSTVLWADAATEVIGVEPNDDMRRLAEEGAVGLDTVRYRAGISSDTGLPDACADIVTISQALHWMEPSTTFQEVARILRPGGVFAAYDCDWPPTINWAAEAAYASFFARLRERGLEERADREVARWSKGEHLARMRASGFFQQVREVAVHHVEVGDARRLVEVALSQGSVQALLADGLDEREIGLDVLHAEVSRALGDTQWRWYWTYRVRMGLAT